MIHLNEFNRELFNNINRDHSNRDQYVPDVKMEDHEEETYYQMYGNNNGSYGTEPKYTTLTDVNFSCSNMNTNATFSNHNNISNNNNNSIYNNRNVSNDSNQNIDSTNMQNNRNSTVNNNNTNNNTFKSQPVSTYCGPAAVNPPCYNRNYMLRHHSNIMNPNTDSIMCSTDTTSSMRGGSYMVSSDGEGSPKSIDENESSPVYCVRGVRTITRNPGRIPRQKGGNAAGITKYNSRGTTSRASRKSTEFMAPKEKDRARSFNEAFDCLRKRIPSIPASKKLSKIEILRLSICYMSYLKFVLENDVKDQNYDSPTISSSTPSPTSIEEDTTTNLSHVTR